MTAKGRISTFVRQLLGERSFLVRALYLLLVGLIIGSILYFSDNGDDQDAFQVESSGTFYVCQTSKNCARICGKNTKHEETSGACEKDPGNQSIKETKEPAWLASSYGER